MSLADIATVVFLTVVPEGEGIFDILPVGEKALSSRRLSSLPEDPRPRRLPLPGEEVHGREPRLRHLAARALVKAGRQEACR
jgi:hypothetical protein